MKKNLNQNTKTQNTFTYEEVANKLDGIIEQFKAFESNYAQPYRSARNKILAENLDLFRNIKGRPKLIKAINDKLDTLRIEHNTKTSLAVKLMRASLRESSQRAFTYAKVIAEADKQNVASSDLSKWIEDEGGIENIRSSNSKTGKRKISENAEEAAEYYSTFDALFKIEEHLPELEPNPEATNHYSVALVRPGKNVAFEIVYCTNKKSTVNQVLSDAGSKLSADQSATQVVDANTQKQKAVAAEIQSAKASN